MPTTYAIPNGRTAMDATTYTGTGANLAIVNQDNGTTGFKPDLVWVKSRSDAFANILVDSVRGTGKILISNSNGAETGNTGDLIGSFNSNGFNVNTTYAGGTDNGTDKNASTYVGWQWQAGQGTTSNNTSGTITSTVSANTTAGFSIVTFTAPSSGAFTVGHGLGATPNLIIVKGRGQVSNWITFHSSVCTTTSQYLLLNTTAALGSVAGVWGSALPTSTVFGATSGGTTVQSNDTVVAYCWTAIPGFSAFGSYTGNGSADGPFIYTGFRPKYFLWKRTDGGVYNWGVEDSTRNPYNATGLDLTPNTSDAEVNNTPLADFLSNGFKIRNTYGGSNANGGNYIYAAFAENPFKYANAR